MGPYIPTDPDRDGPVNNTGGIKRLVIEILLGCDVNKLWYKAKMG